MLRRLHCDATYRRDSFSRFLTERPRHNGRIEIRIAGHAQSLTWEYPASRPENAKTLGKKLHPRVVTSRSQFTADIAALAFSIAVLRR